MRALLVSRVLQGTKVERYIIFAIGADIFLEAESDSDSLKWCFFFCFQHFYGCLHTSSSYILA